MTDEVAARLDRLIGLFELAFADQLVASRLSIRSDPVVAAILDESGDWTSVGKLKSTLASEKGISEKTIQRRVADLVDHRLLLVDGAGPSRRVKTSGLA